MADQVGNLIGENQHTASFVAPAHPLGPARSKASGAVEENHQALLGFRFHNSASL
jgi:hypothetical protein